MSEAFENDNVNSKELDFLSQVSIGLTQNSEPADIIESLSDSFKTLVKLENINIYIYDENTQIILVAIKELLVM